MLGVAAFVNEILGSLMRGENGDQPLVLLVGLPKGKIVRTVHCELLTYRPPGACCKV